MVKDCLGSKSDVPCKLFDHEQVTYLTSLMPQFPGDANDAYLIVWFYELVKGSIYTGAWLIVSTV